MMQTCPKCPEGSPPQIILSMESHLEWHTNVEHRKEGIHEPDEWKIVTQDGPVVISAMCKCGNDNCYFVATVYEASNNWQDSESKWHYLTRRLRDFNKG